MINSVSLDNHSVHNDEVWSVKRGHPKPVVHGLQVLAFTAPGATLFPHYIGEVFIAFTELSCSFLKEVHTGGYAIFTIGDYQFDSSG